MKFLEAHIYQSRQGSSCSQVFGLASTAGLTNCFWIASSKAPSTPFCHCLLTNASRLSLPDTCLLRTFCSLLSDGLLYILAWLTRSCFICRAAASPASDRVESKSQLWPVSKELNSLSDILHGPAKFSFCFISQVFIIVYCLDIRLYGLFHEISLEIWANVPVACIKGFHIK